MTVLISSRVKLCGNKSELVPSRSSHLLEVSFEPFLWREVPGSPASQAILLGPLIRLREDVRQTFQAIDEGLASLAGESTSAVRPGCGPEGFQTVENDVI